MIKKYTAVGFTYINPLMLEPTNHEDTRQMLLASRPSLPFSQSHLFSDLVFG